jgi:hypothetical protein
MFLDRNRGGSEVVVSRQLLQFSSIKSLSIMTYHDGDLMNQSRLRC